jgi:hypothetical protein
VYFSKDIVKAPVTKFLRQAYISYLPGIAHSVITPLPRISRKEKR